MQPRSALQQASCRLRLAACPYRIRLHPGRNSPYYDVYETRAGGRSQSARGYRIDRDGDLGELVELLLAAQRNLLRGGTGLWPELHRERQRETTERIRFPRRSTDWWMPAAMAPSGW